jgi:predicted transcriptional regulator
LAKLLNKDYGNVWRDAKILESMGIIELKKVGPEVQPIALYERIVFDLSTKRIIDAPSVGIRPTLNH